MDRTYDIVIFGATGFTGKHTIDAVYKTCRTKGHNLKFAVAGRSHEKLKSILEEAKERTGSDATKLPIVIADVTDEKSLREMAKKTKVVLNCCGSFILYGEPVVKACIAEGTNYVDITGEPYFVEKIRAYYNEAAREKGVYIVSACGVDCVPCDLGVLYVQENFPGTLNSVELYVEMTCEHRTSKGPSFNSGTWSSLLHHTANFYKHLKISKLNKPKGLPTLKPELRTRFLPHTAPILEKAAAIFPSADKATAEQTQAYLYHNERRRPAQVNVYVVMDSYVHLFLLAMASFVYAILSQVSFTRNLLIKYPKAFTFGFFDRQPSEEEIQKWEFCVTMLGEGWRDKSSNPNQQFTSKIDQRIVGRVRGKNPGYGATCIASSLCAKMFITEADKLPKKGGVYSPGAAFAKTSLIKQLNENGVTFELISVPTNV